VFRVSTRSEYGRGVEKSMDNRVRKVIVLIKKQNSTLILDFSATTFNDVVNTSQKMALSFLHTS
jgi:hypothetical protein